MRKKMLVLAMFISFRSIHWGFSDLHALYGVRQRAGSVDEVSVFHVFCDSLQEAQRLVEDDGHRDLGKFLKSMENCQLSNLTLADKICLTNTWENYWCNTQNIMLKSSDWCCNNCGLTLQNHWCITQPVKKSFCLNNPLKSFPSAQGYYDWVTVTVIHCICRNSLSSPARCISSGCSKHW